MSVCGLHYISEKCLHLGVYILAIGIPMGTDYAAMSKDVYIGMVIRI